MRTTIWKHTALTLALGAVSAFSFAQVTDSNSGKISDNPSSQGRMPAATTSGHDNSGSSAAADARREKDRTAKPGSMGSGSNSGTTGSDTTAGTQGHGNTGIGTPPKASDTSRSGSK